MANDSLGMRMKRYECVTKTVVTPRMPCIIRVDGKAFHTFTKGFEKPFDHLLMDCMQETAVGLCSEVGNCKLAYQQSDEISLLLVDYDTYDKAAWFDSEVQKMVSVAASIATREFNKAFRERALQAGEPYVDKVDSALFDARVFVLSKDEVVNYFIWRQLDAVRNSIQMVAQSLFTHKQLHGKNCDQLQDMMFTEKGVNWNDCTVSEKRGVCVIRKEYLKGDTVRHTWVVDKDIPNFTQNREYINQFVNV